MAEKWPSSDHETVMCIELHFVTVKCKQSIPTWALWKHELLNNVGDWVTSLKQDETIFQKISYLMKNVTDTNLWKNMTNATSYFGYCKCKSIYLIGAASWKLWDSESLHWIIFCITLEKFRELELCGSPIMYISIAMGLQLYFSFC